MAQAASGDDPGDDRLVADESQLDATLAAVLRLRGQRGVGAAPHEVQATWRRLLSEASAAAGPPGPLVVDTSGLDFMGCCAYAALAEEAERCQRRGVALRLVSNQPVVSRVVAACGLTELLPVDNSVDTALSVSDL